MFDEFVDLCHVTGGGLVEILLGADHVVLTGLAVLLDAFEFFDRLTADVADGDLRVLSLALPA